MPGQIVFGGMYFKPAPQRISTNNYPRVELTHTHTHTIGHQETGCHDEGLVETTNCRLRHTKIAYIDGGKLERVTDCIFLGFKIAGTVTAAMKLKDACSLEEKQ